MAPNVVHLRQAWPGQDPAPGAVFDIPALEFCDRVNWLLPSLTDEVIVLSDGLTEAADGTIRSLVDHARGWDTATVARDDSCPGCRMAAVPRATLIDVGGLNPAIRAFYWLDDLERRLPAVSRKFVALHDRIEVREVVLLDFAVEAVQDLDRLDQPL